MEATYSSRVLHLSCITFLDFFGSNHGGKWIIREGSGGNLHPVVLFTVKKKEQDEYPFTRVIKLWSDRDRADGLAIRYNLLKRGEVRKAERFFMSLLTKLYSAQ